MDRQLINTGLCHISHDLDLNCLCCQIRSLVSKVYNWPLSDSHFLNITFSQISVILDGAISMDFVIWRVKNVLTGQQLSRNVVTKTRSLLMWPMMRKTFIFSIATMEKNPGWAWMTSPGRVTLLGRIGVRGTLQLGRRINRITLMKKTACTHLVWDTTMNGMTWNVVIVISTLVRKVEW